MFYISIASSFKMKIKDMPRQNRPRERFVSQGVGALSDSDKEDF